MAAGPAAAGGDGGGSSITRIVANIFISFIGAGVLGLPYAFKEAGLLEGTIVMSVVCYLSVKAMLLLIDCKYMVQAVLDKDGGEGTAPLLIEMLREEAGANGEDADEAEAGAVEVKGKSNGNGHNRRKKKKKQITYSDVGFAAYGSAGRMTVDAALLVSQVGFCCAYLIFITENLATFVQGLAQHQWLVVILPPLFFLTLVPDLNNLAVFSLLAQISNLFAFAVVFWFDFDHLHLASPEHRREFSVSGFPFFFSIAIYCFEGAGMILSLEESVAEDLRPRFKRLFVWTIVSVTCLYVTFGVSGYLSYGAETKDIITLNLPAGVGVDFALLVKACLSFSLFFTYPIMLFPVTKLLEDRCTPVGLASSSTVAAVYPKLVRLVLVSMTGLVVIAVPRFADLMALVGATCCTLLAFIMPGLCHLVISTKYSGEKNVDPTLNYVLVITGVLGALLGTSDALVKISS